MFESKGSGVFGQSTLVGFAGTMGLVGDLTAGEILEQLVFARAVAPIKNVVFMVPPWALKSHGSVLCCKADSQ